MGCSSGKLPDGEDVNTGWIYLKCQCSKEGTVYKKKTYTCDCGEIYLPANKNKTATNKKFETHCIYKGDEYYERMNIAHKNKKPYSKEKVGKTTKKSRESNINVKPNNKGKKSRNEQTRKATVTIDDIDNLSEDFSSKCTIRDDNESTTKYDKTLTTDPVLNTEMKSTWPKIATDNSEITEHNNTGNEEAHILQNLKEQNKSELYHKSTESEFQEKDRHANDEYDSKITEYAFNEKNNTREIHTSVNCEDNYDGNETVEQMSKSLSEIKEADLVPVTDKFQSEEEHQTVEELAQTNQTDVQSDPGNNTKIVSKANECDTNKSEEDDTERIRQHKNEINKLQEEETKSTELEKKMNELQDIIHNISREKTRQKEELENLRQEKDEIEKTAHSRKLELERKENNSKESIKELDKLKQTKRSLETEIVEVSKKHRRIEQDLDKNKQKLHTHEKYWTYKQTLQQFQEDILSIKPKPLHNLGNTCFMDAMLQNIAWCPKLGNELKKQLIDMLDLTITKPREMTCCLFNLVHYTHSAESSKELSKSSVPERILQAARRRNDVFNGYRQQDSFEMFNTIVDALKDEMLSFYKDKEPGKSKDEIIRKYGAVRLFYGKFITVFNYSSCNHVETVYQSFTSVTVPIIKRKKPLQGTLTPESDFKYGNNGSAKSDKKRKRKRQNKKQDSKSNVCDEFAAIESPDNQNNSDHLATDFSSPKRAKKRQSSSDDDENFYDAQESIINVDTKSAGTQTDEHNSAFSSIENLTSSQDANKSPAESTEALDSSKRVLPFDTLRRSNGNETDIEYGLSHGLMAEETFGENIMSCRKCVSPSTSGTCYKKTLICEAPYVLVLHIDRFKEDYNGGLLKRNDLVTYPADLDLQCFCSTAVKKLYTDCDTKLQYKLYGVVAHSGSMNSGHYIAYIKTTGRTKATWYDEIAGRCLFDPAIKKQEIESFLEGKDLAKATASDDEKSHWFYISDEHIMECKQNEAVDNQNAYVLMYERL